MRPLKAPAYYVERIEQATKLRELNKKWRWCQSFSEIVPHMFSDTGQSNLITSNCKHFKQLFSLQKSKTNHPLLFKPVSTVFNFSP